MRIHSTAGPIAAGPALAVVLALGTTLALPATAAAADEPGRSRRTATTPQVAAAALAEAEAAVTDASEGGDESHRDLTLTMRDLFVAKHALRGGDRADADSLLLRPTTPPDDPTDPRDVYYGEDADLRTQCGDTFCLHWVQEGEHAATPGFAATAFETIADVAGTYAAAGFRTPLPDEGQEGDTRTDFYLGELDQYGALGFCRSDAAGPVVGSAWYGYCAFDNDYASSTWLDQTSLLRATVAHEYFHAVQFAYDAEDDGWLMESTATAMEDELYDDVNDNAFFLNYGQMGDPEAGYPLAGPSTPLDTFDLSAYGNWGFWRFLTERHADETAGVPDLAREIWEALDTTRGPNPAFSLQALDEVLSTRDTSTPREYVAFAAANQHPADVYDEAIEQAYPTAPNTIETAQLSRKAPSATRSATLDHLTSATGAALPYAGSRWLTVRVDLEEARIGRAAVTVYRVDGSPVTAHVRTDRRGKGRVTVPFAPYAVSSVEVTVANASTRMVGCGASSAFSCGGVGADDGLVADIRFRATD